MTRESEGLHIQVPGFQDLRIRNLVLDYTGTLSRDGRLLEGVPERLRALSSFLRIIVATADTFGMARSELKDLPVEIVLIRDGRDKVRLISELGTAETAAVGNGRNDVGMIRAAALGAAVIGPEGCYGDLVTSAVVVFRDIRDCLDLFLEPLRATATLRE